MEKPKELLPEEIVASIIAQIDNNEPTMLIFKVEGSDKTTRLEKVSSLLTQCGVRKMVYHGGKITFDPRANAIFSSAADISPIDSKVREAISTSLRDI